MALPHFRNLQSTNTRWEPVYQQLFEITVQLPTIISTPNSTTIMLENATNINLNDTTPGLNLSEQRFKYATRRFVNTPDSSLIRFSITFNINQNDSKVIETWDYLKKWYDLVWNSQTGELHYKHDLIGQISVNVHDRTGEVIRRVDFVNAQILNIQDMTFDWGNPGIIENVTANFVADYWNDLYFDVE